MNSDNEIELAIGTQGSEGRSEPVGYQMQHDSPPRTMSPMQGMTLGAYIGGNVRYGLPAGVLTPPGLRLNGSWYNAPGYRLTDNLYSQIPQENFNGSQDRSVEEDSPSGEEDGAVKGTREGQENFNGAQDRSVEEDAPSGEEDGDKGTREGRVEGEPSPEYTPQVMTRLSGPQKEGLAATLIDHVSGDVPLEKWLNVETDKKKKKIHDSWGKCLRAGFRTPVEGKRGRWGG
jgi:hypothetical protein